jgi:hypothetical protein
MASSDGGTTADQIQNNDYTGDGYGGSEAAIDAIEAFVDECVTDQMVVSSRSIANGADVDARVQEIGKTLGARLDGRTPDGFLDDVELDTWRDTCPRKWVITRVAGEIAATRTPGQYLFKPDLVVEISEAVGGIDDEYYLEEDEARRVVVSAAWKRAVTRAVAERTDNKLDALLTGYDEESWMSFEQYVGRLSKIELASIVEKLLDIDEPLATTYGWPREMLIPIHDVLVTGIDRPALDDGECRP